MAINDPNQQQTPQSSGQPRQLGTGFTNLQNIMQANTGNKLGQAVGSGIQQTGQQASNALQSGVQDFNTQSQANALGTQAQKQNVQDVFNKMGIGNSSSNGSSTTPTTSNGIYNPDGSAVNRVTDQPVIPGSGINKQPSQTITDRNGNPINLTQPGGTTSYGGATNISNSGIYDPTTNPYGSINPDGSARQMAQDVGGGQQPSQYRGISNLMQPTNTTPMGPTTADITAFANYRSGQYNGPTDIANISNIQNQAQNAQQQGQEVGTAGGRQALLQQYAANPGSSYGSGAQNLDSLLLGSTGGKQLQQARQSVSGLNNQVNAAQTTAQQTGQQLTNQAQGFGQQVTGQVQGAQENIYNQAESDATKANAAQNTAFGNEQTAIQNAQANNQLSSAALQALGLQSGQRTYGTNLGQYLGYSQNGQQITDPNQLQQANAMNIMGQPQLQQYSGLNQLMGQGAVAAPQQSYQAGQATYNQSGLQGAIGAGQAQLTPLITQLNQAQADYNAAQGGGGNSLAGIFMKQAAQQRLAQAQNQYNALNAQLSGTVSATDANTPQTIPGVS